MSACGGVGVGVGACSVCVLGGRAQAQAQAQPSRSLSLPLSSSPLLPSIPHQQQHQHTHTPTPHTYHIPTPTRPACTHWSYCIAAHTGATSAHACAANCRFAPLFAPAHDTQRHRVSLHVRKFAMCCANSRPPLTPVRERGGTDRKKTEQQREVTAASCMRHTVMYGQWRTGAPALPALTPPILHLNQPKESPICIEHTRCLFVFAVLLNRFCTGKQKSCSIIGKNQPKHG